MHEFHLSVRRCFDQIESAAIRFLFAPECGGIHRLPLYATAEARREHAYCCVDGIGAADTIRMVLEIEEEKVPKPSDLLGKFYAAAHCTHFIASRTETPVALGSTAFIQIVSTDQLNRSGALSRGSRKPSQWTNIERGIRDRLRDPLCKFSSYKLFSGTRADFDPGGALHALFVEYLRTIV